MSTWDPARAAAFYDDYGEREWVRFENGISSPVSLEIHRHYLRRFVRAGERVLEVGAGPGRFTIELARIGARITVADISPEQLRLNADKVAEAGAEAAVEERVVADVLDLSRWDDGEFDAAVCYGGPVSYVLDRADDAIAELLRVTRTGGLVLFGVMSRVGPFAQSLPVVADLAREHGTDVTDEVIETGILPPELSRGHLTMRLFRWSELEEILARRPCELVAASASNLSFAAEQALWPELEPELRETILRWEIELAAEPGAINIGEHIIVVVRKT
jgi:ubiquinone/menaquinone biosynthesis C-methylase UbiE